MATFLAASQVVMQWTLVLLVVLAIGQSFRLDLTANLRLDKENIRFEGIFKGNDTFPDYFKILERDDNLLLVGARDYVYAIRLEDFRQVDSRKLVWTADAKSVASCQVKGKTEEICHNFIRVLKKTGDNSSLICGTHAFAPKCRQYEFDKQENAYEMKDEKDGIARCPRDPQQNSTAVWVDGQLYSAAVSDFIGSDPLIFRDPDLRTANEPIWLNKPHFVSSFAHEEHVYFFFRETAVEYINCGKAIYSRVARVCKNDKGGAQILKDRFTSFMKSRLNCSMPGEYPFYFDEIKSTTHLVDTYVNGVMETVVYAVFTTPENSISGSAVCAFRMKDILETFEGPFKGRDDVNANWLPVKNNKVPRPGSCVNDSTKFLDSTLNFISDHPLMDMAVPALHGQPLLRYATLDDPTKFSQIAIDSQILSVDGKKYDVMFIGTTDGKIIKSIYIQHSNGQIEPVIIEELQVLEKSRGTNSVITNLHMYRQTGADGQQDERLVVVSNEALVALPVHRCATRMTCEDCVKLQDPYCAWEVGKSCVHTNHKNMSLAWGGLNENVYIQNIISGKDDRCEEEDRTTTNAPGTTQDLHHKTLERIVQSESISEPKPQQLQSSGKVYQAETLALAICISIILAVLVGFLVGYRFSIWHHRTRDGDIPYKENTLRQMPREAQHLNHTSNSDGYIANNKPPVNLVLNVSPKNDGKSPNVALNTYNSDTLNKAKKVYL